MTMSRVLIMAVVLEGRSKSAVARDYGVSRRWVQILAARYLAAGETAAGARSRGPHASPRQASEAVQDAVVALRKQLAEAGHDAGAETIAWHLRQQAGSSPATIWRILSRRGFIIPQPHKRPRSSWRRFEAEQPKPSSTPSPATTTPRGLTGPSAAGPLRPPGTHGPGPSPPARASASASTSASAATTPTPTASSPCGTTAGSTTPVRICAMARSSEGGRCTPEARLRRLQKARGIVSLPETVVSLSERKANT
jgi:transposase